MLELGIKGSYELVVTEELLAANVGSGEVRVYATPMLVAAVERTAAASVAALLEPGKVTVGTLIQLSHVSATPEGMRVRFESELTEIAGNGKLLSFRVAAYDEKGLIGEGTHQRAIVDRERFEKKAAEKRELKGEE